jgi:hypothetical protein
MLRKILSTSTQVWFRLVSAKQASTKRASSLCSTFEISDNIVNRLQTSWANQSITSDGRSETIYSDRGREQFMIDIAFIPYAHPSRGVLRSPLLLLGDASFQLKLALLLLPGVGRLVSDKCAVSTGDAGTEVPVMMAFGANNGRHLSSFFSSVRER